MTPRVRRFIRRFIVNFVGALLALAGVVGVLWIGMMIVENFGHPYGTLGVVALIVFVSALFAAWLES